MKVGAIIGAGHARTSTRPRLWHPAATMNWLAHAFLSEPNIEFRLGNLLSDIVRGDARAAVGAEFLRGAQRHHAIDAFTDAHPIVRRSRTRIVSVPRRFSGVLVDIFYDHLLTQAWERHATVPLTSFTAAFYADARASSVVLPSTAQRALDHIVRYDLLSSYGEFEGVRQALRGVSMRLARRWHREFALEAGVQDLIVDHAGFEDDFAQFFPELRAHVESLG